MIARLEIRMRRWRRALSRSEWAIRLLGLQPSQQPETAPGLVLIQIDGLARRQLERAIARGRMPFLAYLMRRQNYRLHSFYSGLPSSTPAVQGELFYGERCAVPAFSFYVRETGEVVRMFNPASAGRVEEELKKSRAGLLEGGASYSNIYMGGAEEAHFCASSSGWGETIRRNLPLSLPLLILINLWSVLRVAALFFLELGIALYDMLRGVLAGYSFLHEMKFVLTRMSICIVMREFIVIASKIDVARGLPIIHLNFLGYDEQAHRRGPDSLFAHWALKGIDDSIKRIYAAAHSSLRRDYDVWVYSDHGQEGVRSYVHEHGHDVQDAIAAVFREKGIDGGESSDTPAAAQADARARRAAQRAQRAQREGEGHQRGQLLLGAKNRLRRRAVEPERPDPTHLIVTAMGPIGHIYSPRKLEDDEREELAQALVRKAHVPIVLYPGDNESQAIAWTHNRRYVLPDEADVVLGADHPFLREAAEDLVRLVHHRHAGDFVISGLRHGRKPLTFPIENGAHAGPGPHETEAFALLPRDAPLITPYRNFIRPADLREAALHHLGRVERRAANPGAPAAFAEHATLRVMSYNVHGCVGMDGRHSPARIARVIAQYDPDIVALQELDVGRARSGNVDQAEIIADLLRMDHHFHPALRMEEEKYGDAIFSRYPMRLVRAGSLPGLPNRPRLEPRGALWVEVDLGGLALQVVNTHLGLLAAERNAQIEALLGPEWLGCVDCRMPLILLGDFNSLPRSLVCRRVKSRLRDVQEELERHRPRATWFGRVPVGRIDHVFVNPGIEVTAIEVPRSRLARVASDHLPLIAELKIPVPPSD